MRDRQENLRLDTSYESFYIEHIDLSQNDDLEGSEKKFIGMEKNYKKIDRLIFICWAGLFILILRVGYLQIMKGEYHNYIAEGNRSRIRYIKPRRGIIYDRNYNPLVVNIPSFSLKIIQSDLPQKEEERIQTIQEVARLTGEDYKNIIKLLDEKKEYYYQPIIIKENIDYNKAMLLYVKSVAMPGIVLEEVSKRKYQSTEELNSVSHILGYDGKISEEELKKREKGYLLDDYIGKSGVELSYEKILRGEMGESKVETNALGKEIRIISQTDALAGSDLVLTINLELQNFIENLVKEELKKIHKERAAVIVMNPENGEILSLVSLPSFNNNLFVGGIATENYNRLINDKNKPLFNRSIAGEYPPGSTFKPILSAIGLERGIITENTSVRSTGGIYVGKWFFPDWRAGGHGIVNVKTAIANSVNTFFYYLGGGYNDFQGLGIDQIYEGLRYLNLGNKTNIDLPGEKAGFVPSASWKEKTFNEAWYIGDTYHLSIGQGYLLMTPIQIAVYTSFIANGGTLYKPQIVKEFIHPDKKISAQAAEYIKKDIISKNNIEIVREGMRGTIQYGSARSLSTLPFSLAGKTGTAQTGKGDSHAWFISFAPYDKPEIAMTILVEEGGEGSSVAVPIARKIYEYWWEKVRK